jgi:uracil-DNA glycosylase
VTRIARFLDLLRGSPPGAVFNPWWQVDAENDIGADAPRIRREHLQAYLHERVGRARLALVAEALGYRGGHFTGIPMTSERLLLGAAPVPVLTTLAPRRTSRPEMSPRGFAEPTASIVWRALLELGVPSDGFVLWNAFAWHSFDPRGGLLSNRPPTRAELVQGRPVLEAFLTLCHCEHVIALGRLAASQLADAPCVRHPASGGATRFRDQLAAIVSRA